MMGSRKFHLHDGRRGAALAVRVTPHASQNEIADIQPDGTVIIRLMAASANGEGNTSLIAFLAKIIGVKTSQIDIIGGASGNDKLLSILDIDSDEVHQHIASKLKH
jgi:uncharacterized protein YggU (UPF0235/DUF167 family)